jgi:hypothetical protein
MTDVKDKNPDGTHKQRGGGQMRYCLVMHQEDGEGYLPEGRLLARLPRGTTDLYVEAHWVITDTEGKFHGGGEGMNIELMSTPHEGFRDDPEIPRFGADDPPEYEPDEEEYDDEEEYELCACSAITRQG